MNTSRKIVGGNPSARWKAKAPRRPGLVRKPLLLPITIRLRILGSQTTGREKRLNLMAMKTRCREMQTLRMLHDVIG